jgi:hypothetical protein
MPSESVNQLDPSVLEVSHADNFSGHTMSPSLLLALAVLVVWALLTFASGPHGGAIHLLLALGTTLLVRWWALRV